MYYNQLRIIFFVGELLISTREILIVAPIFERLTGLRRTKWNSIESNWGLESDRNLHFSRSFFSAFLLGPAIGVTSEIGGRKLVDFHRKLLLIFGNVGEKPSPMGPTEINFFPLFVEIRRIASNKFVFSEQTRFFRTNSIFLHHFFLITKKNGRFFLVKKISTLFSCLRNSPPFSLAKKISTLFSWCRKCSLLVFYFFAQSSRAGYIQSKRNNSLQWTKLHSTSCFSQLIGNSCQKHRPSLPNPNPVSQNWARARAHLRFTARKFHTC